MKRRFSLKRAIVIESLSEKRRTAGVLSGTRRGQMVVLLVLLVPVLLGATALAVDIGVFYFQWAQLQKAADAAALAGAGYLPGNATQAISTARTYATMNGIQTSEITSTTLGSNNQTITVALTRSVPYYFGAVLGLKSQAVSVKATAGLQTTGSVLGVVPVGIDSRTTYTFGQPITLVQGSPSSWTWGPGNWGALSLGGTGANNFGNNVVNGYQQLVRVGDMVNTESGKMTGQVRSSFQTRISAGQASDPGGTISSHTLTDARVLVVPMVNFSAVSGQAPVPVLGFAVLWLVSIDSQLNINTAFIQEITPGGQPGSGGDYGGYKAILIG